VKEKIYTIPINDAFDSDCECPICEFLRTQEDHLLDYTLGASMMEPDERIISNEKGYCNHHYRLLLHGKNQLSLALILESHIDELCNTLEQNARQDFSASKGLFSKNKILPERLSEMAGQFKNSSHRCVICDKLDAILEKFIENLFFLLKSDPEFERKFYSCKGFCIPHFAILLEGCAKYLKNERQAEVSKKLCKMQAEHIRRIKEDVTWYTKKFDYRYEKEDWKNSRDAVPRACQKLEGYIR